MEHNRIIYERPYDSEVEYLRSTGTQYIDTEIKANSNIKVDLEGLFRNTATHTRFGARVTQSASCFLFITTAFGQFRIDIGTGNAGQIQWTITNNTPLNRVIIDAKNKNAIIYRTDSTTESHSFSSSDFTSNNAITLFGFNNNGEIMCATSMQVSSLKIYDNNILIKDFIPVRKGSIGYMYDKVSKKLFGNKGTGNFILGPDVANPVPNIRRVFRFGNKRFVAISND